MTEITKYISVVVVVLNEVSSIDLCVQSLLEQDYEFPYEIVIVDNGSTDGTLEKLTYYERTYPLVKIIHNPIRGIVFSRNIGVQESQYPFIAFTDGDCIAPPHWLSSLISGYIRYKSTIPGLCAVGGSNTVLLPNNIYSSALRIMLQTYLGSHGSVNGKHYSGDRVIDHLPTTNVCYLQSVLLKYPFDTTMIIGGSDLEISQRLQRSGFQFMYIDNATIQHCREDSLYFWGKSMFKYGRSRLHAMSKNPDWMQEGHMLLPLLLVISIIISPIGIIYIWFVIPILFYLISIALYSIWHAIRNKNIVISPMLFLLYLTTHICYGVGQFLQVYQLIRGKIA